MAAKKTPTKRVSPNYSIGQKARFAKMSPEDRSKRGSNLAQLRWAKTSKKKRREHALKMVKARVV